MKLENTEVVANEETKHTEDEKLVAISEPPMTILEPKDTINCPLLCSPGEDLLVKCMGKRCGFFSILNGACSISVIGDYVHAISVQTSKSNNPKK